MVDWQTPLFAPEAIRFPLEQGQLELHPGFLDATTASVLMDHLLEVCEWQQETVQLFGKEHLQPRLTCWFGFGMSAKSRYSSKMPALPWTGLMRKTKEKVEAFTKTDFNSVLVNYYRDGSDGMGMHSDDEPILGDQPLIASLSLGVLRSLRFQHRTDKEKRFQVQGDHGSLLIMGGELQRFWKHGINKSKRIDQPRINLTFRKLHL